MCAVGYNKERGAILVESILAMVACLLLLTFTIEIYNLLQARYLLESSTEETLASLSMYSAFPVRDSVQVLNDLPAASSQALNPMLGCYTKNPAPNCGNFVLVQRLLNLLEANSHLNLDSGYAQIQISLSGTAGRLGEDSIPGNLVISLTTTYVPAMLPIGNLTLTTVRSARWYGRLSGF